MRSTSKDKPSPLVKGKGNNQTRGFLPRMSWKFPYIPLEKIDSYEVDFCFSQNSIVVRPLIARNTWNEKKPVTMSAMKHANVSPNRTRKSSLRGGSGNARTSFTVHIIVTDVNIDAVDE